MTKKYEMSVPIVGYFVVEVEADDEEQAVKQAMETELPFGKLPDNLLDIEYEFVEHVVRGNVFYGSMCDVQVEELGDVE